MKAKLLLLSLMVFSAGNIFAEKTNTEICSYIENDSYAALELFINNSEISMNEITCNGIESIKYCVKNSAWTIFQQMFFMYGSNVNDIDSEGRTILDFIRSELDASNNDVYTNELLRFEELTTRIGGKSSVK